jgi:XTP/dITP diphosphohydrolase
LKLLLASNNQGKLKEMCSLLDDFPAQLVTPSEIGLALEVEETGKTYTENAVLKAQAYASAAHLPVLADDSGLEVDALGGAPGIYSARFSSKQTATDEDRRLYLLERLSGKPRPWIAKFRCVVALVDRSGIVHCAEGECAGEIIPEERGDSGFGYDPIFLLPELGQTMAELGMEQKNQLSHRARAVHAARPMLLKTLT